MSYYLIHQTRIGGLEGILENEAILSIRETKADRMLSEGIEFSDESSENLTLKLKEYENKIFTSLLVPIKSILKDFTGEDYTWKNVAWKGIYLIFSSDILKDSNNKFYCKGWNYGQFYEDKCIGYDKESTPNQNIESCLQKDKDIYERQIRNGYLGINNTLLNEIVFTDGSKSSSLKIPLDSKNEKGEKILKYIYIHIPKEENRLNEWFDDEVEKIKDLKEKYPQYEWTIDLEDEIPFSEMF